ncbi:MAG: succinate dehydrogenase flavoprotein subunit [Comamonas sp.]|jgi:succinate dehydrogenase / fumarate reductase flavoprotein subunit|uniref:Succinate dehydrogenase flavoprotein subunit n=1 Tax=Comamonas denitrificans TaxID=117506 RepID=A0A939KAS3_9BURK|nr:succinate dehydrogenase flavoprotein subunit [Comamonas denitrificans]MBP6042525.1 succinate dehydrogenase flavoprotein subunit [Comamonas sp.]MBO1248657.1 succinate dehydrogenase flavoprotein subunit [Comamonas denitrificans]MBP6292703.1 succinate dehydrogenase flavoprotein subunit [Comamonas sp.]MBP7789738.1 succinate dehydrogenase flavoprotein subunit [Comamonas sp.]MBP7840638.1 succinate dehydrogenase flavoprotein subunit [Comamonas sp.]
MSYSKANITKRKFDVVIVGAGGSGLRAAIELSKAGLSVASLSKVFPTRSHTVAAQGGVSASLGNMSEDNWHYHFYDTIKGGDWLSDQDAVEFMCREAPKVVIELEHFGMPFDRNADGTIYQRPFGGHTSNYGEKPVQRACAAADRTGHAMLHTLYQKNVAYKTNFFVEWMALDLIRNTQGDVVGVTAIELETGDLYELHAKAVLLATGGAGRIFQASTNAFINTGDGLGMAARAGIPLQDLEFWQFHPTGVAGAGVLLTEGCRGEGAILLNSEGEAFMERYAPTLKDLAPRDFVSRSMDQEIKEGRGCGPNKDYILMKLDHLGAETIRKRLPSVEEIGHNFANVDITKEPIPVVPTIHYQMGGIPTNIHGQVVTWDGTQNKVVNGLYAVGECAAVSVHGANRLGTNSLLDLLVFGKSAGKHITSYVKDFGEHKEVPTNGSDRTLERLNQLDNSKDGIYAQDLAGEIRQTMQTHAGVFRTQKSMDEGVVKIAEIRQKVGQVTLQDKSKVWNTARMEALEVDNLIEVAQATMVSAAARKECRGAHTVYDYEHPADHPEHPLGRNDKEWLKHTLWDSATNSLTYKPVNMKPLTVESIPPKVRTF